MTRSVPPQRHRGRRVSDQRNKAGEARSTNRESKLVLRPTFVQIKQARDSTTLVPRALVSLYTVDRNSGFLNIYAPRTPRPRPWVTILIYRSCTNTSVPLQASCRITLEQRPRIDRDNVQLQREKIEKEITLRILESVEIVFRANEEDKSSPRSSSSGTWPFLGNRLAGRRSNRDLLVDYAASFSSSPRAFSRRRLLASSREKHQAKM